MKANIGRNLLAFLCWGPIVDLFVSKLDRHHINSPDWNVHARFHAIWEVITLTLLSLILFHVIVRHWRRLSAPLRLAVTALLSSWYVGEVITYVVVAPFVFPGVDALPHAQLWVIVPSLKLVVLAQASIVATIAIAYLLDRKFNPPVVGAVGP